ncbi:transcription factor TGAL6-like isoform X2 [Phragmites australis]|uniref:transcription factor TGAL6-like isoform X2 n=1 Tax=Phragmites australis TaxID=29695 RepID=UPI002D78F06B|nr:transcription factor TGAL6-like isoform X2 [Phragmites australis]XP_062226896.1 transcription factor TGAL6-like isoform X2 [Phragmites australis]
MEFYPGYLEDHFNIHKLSAASPPEYMTSASAQFAAPVRIGVYERPGPAPVIGMWNNEPFKVDSGLATSASTIMEADTKFDTRLEDVPQVALQPARSTDQETSRPRAKVLRRLAQNREAARKSRLRKKAYIQQLETSRMKLGQLEQELQRARQQGVYANGNLGDSTLGFSGSIDAGVAAFEIDYNHWVDEQNRHTAELRTTLQGQTTELELRILVETGLSNYEHLFRIKAIAANYDVFYVMSGMWKTPAERFFLWIGGFRPSEVLKILSPQLEPLTEPQFMAVSGLQQTATQAEDALSQGMEKLQQNVAESLTVTNPFDSSDAYMLQMETAVDKLKELVGFVIQADHLRQTTLQEMHKILTTRQAARGLLLLGDYFQRLRALSQLWAARPRESAIS